MYHPTTLSTLAESRQDELMRDATNIRRARRATGPGTFPGQALVAHHPRLVTTTVALLVVLGVLAA